MTERRGLFVTFEGIEGVGKSSQIELAARHLRAAGHAVRPTREPGGTRAGEAMRDILLHQVSVPLCVDAELLLMFAARAQHLAEVIDPALKRGEIVLCDRFTDATFAYQGGGRGVIQARIRSLAGWVHPDLEPDLTILLDAPVATGMARARARGGGDRFETEHHDFFERVRRAYLELADGAAGRIQVVNADRPMAEIHDEVITTICGRMGP